MKTSSRKDQILQLRRKSGQSGYALIIALLLLALFAVVVGEFVRSSYVEGIAAENRLQLCATKLALDGAEERALAIIALQEIELKSKKTSGGKAIDKDNYILYGTDYITTVEGGSFSVKHGSSSEEFKCSINIRISDESTRIPLKLLTYKKSEEQSKANNIVAAQIEALVSKLHLNETGLADTITDWEQKNNRALNSPFELLAALNNKNPKEENRFLVFGGIDTNGDPFPGLAEYLSTNYALQNQSSTDTTVTQSSALVKGYASSVLMVEAAFNASKDLGLETPKEFSASDYVEEEARTRITLTGLPVFANEHTYSSSYKYDPYFADYYRIEITATCGSASSSRTLICYRHNVSTGTKKGSYLEVLSRQPVRAFTCETDYPADYSRVQFATRKHN